MTELINGRTPEEIKLALRCCRTPMGFSCKDCPYNGTCLEHEPEVDALDLIECLEAKQPKWISVTDNLPEAKDEKADCYLVTDGTFIWMAYYACKEWQFAQCTDSPYVIDWTDITHWMPLPEQPKEDA